MELKCEDKMKRKILYCASNDIHIKNFHIPYLKYFKENGFEVHLLSHGHMSFPYVDVKYDIPFKKSILSAKNIQAISEVKNILRQNQYDIISIHTALAGAIVRPAVLLSEKRSTRVIYTSHGYFFWNGGPFVNWLKYLIPEKVCSIVTDSIMAMNQEDFDLARKYKLCKGDVELIPGMGVDLNRFKPCGLDRAQNLRQNFRINNDDFLAVYPAEMSKRKNHKELLKAFAMFLEKVPKGRLLLPGEGQLMEENIALADKLNILERVIFPRYVDNMEEIYTMCDIAVSSAVSEGLPLNIIEAMACGLPVVASRIRGHSDLIEDKINGYLYTLGDSKSLLWALEECYRAKETFKNISIRNILKAEKYSLEKAKIKICNIYEKYM